MSSPPRTPTHSRHQSHASYSHRRHPSSLDLSYNQYSSPGYRNSFSASRRSSNAAYSPVTPRSSRGFDSQFQSSPPRDDSELNDFNGGGGGGLGNLADELADAWSEDELEEGEGDSGLPLDQELENGGHDDDLPNGHGNTHSRNTSDAPRDSGIALDPASSPSRTHKSSSTLSPPQQRNGTRHKRKPSAYDGSDYGDDSDLETADGISPGLEARMAAVESLARRGKEEIGIEGVDSVVARVTEQLRDLAPQAGVENGATRLTTAHSSITTHLNHQARQLASLSSTLLSPLAGPPPIELIDLLLPAIDSTLETIPPTNPQSLLALHSLASQTSDLATSLSYLSDTLHMTRQTSYTAGRYLRGVTEALAGWKRERENSEFGQMWIERGDWDRRLRNREAKKVCDGVVGGFEKYCEGLRGRLVEGLGEVAA